MNHPERKRLQKHMTGCQLPGYLIIGNHAMDNPASSVHCIKYVGILALSTGIFNLLTH
jgi:uncharacterized membrane protein HdeD (DUF308 family)